MQIKIKNIVTLIIVCFGVSLSAQSKHELLRNGDESYFSGDFTTAEEAYRKAIEKEGKSQAKYNLGNSLFEQQRYEEALEQYQAAINSAPTDATKSKAYHNLGNALVSSEKFKESIEAYKQALRYNPEDLETKHNFSYAKQMLKQQQQEQQQQQQSQESQESDENDEQQEQQEQQKQESEEQQEKGEEQQQEQKTEEEQEINNGEQDQQPSEDKQDLDKEDARKLLEIAENEEKKVQEKMRKVSGGKKRKKDW